MQKHAGKRRIGWLALALGIWGIGVPSFAQAQEKPPVERETLSIQVENPAYQIRWDGGEGTLIRRAQGREPERQMPLVYLHTDPGPKGYARYLAWFLAREPEGFTILWCYINETGKDFWCWLYRYPVNQLTTLRFSGSYQFTPPAPNAAAPFDGFALKPTQRYIGPDFSFRDWTRRAGTLPGLALSPVASLSAEGERSPVATPPRNLAKLNVIPLHEVRVAPANGWRNEGWRELHTLAYDATNDPYYLILYSNTTRGFALDLKRAQTFTTDFGAMVQFSTDASAFGRKEDTVTPLPDPGVRRYEIHQIELHSMREYANPFTQVLLEADIRTPEGRRLVVPGFWDGKGAWRIRFAPPRVGLYQWRTRSNDPELHNQEGRFECIPDGGDVKGFVRTHPAPSYARHFAYDDGTPFLPVYASAQIVALPQRAAFQQKIDALAQQGFNRLLGGYLFDAPAALGGGAPLVQGAFDQINPAFFQELDHRIAYCNAKGVVPDLGLGDPNALAGASEGDLRRLWRYLLARYAVHNVNWNLLRALESGSDPKAASASAPEWYSRAEELAGLTRLYDPYKHPITLPVAATESPLPPAPAPRNAPRAASATQEPTEEPLITKKKRPAPIPAPSPLSEESWMDVITLENPALEWLEANRRVNKPTVLSDDPTRQKTATANLRQRMWTTRMRGGYYALQTRAGAEAETLLPEMAALGRFFSKTRFWRLEPRPDMIGGIEETPNQRRRRKRAEAEAAKASGKPEAPPAQTPSKLPAGPIYLLADSAWEYIVYFTQGGEVTLDLLEATGQLKMLWFNPRTGAFSDLEMIAGGAYRRFTAPDAQDWVLYLSRRNN